MKHKYLKQVALDEDGRVALQECKFDLALKTSDKALVVHLFYIEIWQEIGAYLKRLRTPLDIFVTIPENPSPSVVQAVLSDAPDAHIYTVRNRGRDILPFLEILLVIWDLDYDLICKIHTKKSLHRLDGQVWRKLLYYDLLGSNKIVKQIASAFQDNSEIGIIAPRNSLLPYEEYSEKNRTLVKFLAQSCTIPYDEDFRFPAGSMMWVRKDVLRPLYEQHLKGSLKFEKETGQTDGTMAHAVERFLGLMSSARGYKPEESPANYKGLPESLIRELSEVVFQQARKLGHWEADTHRLSTIVNHANEKETQLTAFLQSVQRNSVNLSSSVNGLNEQIFAQQRTIEGQQMTIEGQRQTAESQRSRLLETKNELDFRKAKIEHLKSELSQASAAASALNQQLCEKNTAVRSLQDEISGLQEHHQSTVHQQRDLTRLIDSQRIEILEQNQLMTTQEQRISEQEFKIRDLKGQRENELNRLRSRLREKNEQVDNIYNSRGWRLLGRLHRIKRSLMPHR